AELLSTAEAGENSTIKSLPNFWSELRYNARCGGVVHLDDLLLRRVRIGLLLPDGASAEMNRVRWIVQPEMGWTDAQWQAEEERYRRIYSSSYAPFPTGQSTEITGENPWRNQNTSHPGMKGEFLAEPIALSSSGATLD
ncbi:hypothetical protein EG834_17485, partial [bacterium]|nr:hypothetical protein [bacterium]